MKKSFFALVGSVCASLFFIGQAVFATDTPTQCSPVLTGIGTGDVTKALASAEVDFNQTFDVLNLFKNNDEEWEIVPTEQNYQITITQKNGAVVVCDLSNWKVTKEQNEITFDLLINFYQTDKNSKAEFALKQVLDIPLTGLIVTDDKNGLYLSIDIPESSRQNGVSYPPPVQRHLRPVSEIGIGGTRIFFQPDGDHICLCCNNGGTGCSARGCNIGAACGRPAGGGGPNDPNDGGAFCKWFSRSQAGTFNNSIAAVIAGISALFFGIIYKRTN